MGGTFLPDSPNSLLERGFKQQVSSHCFLPCLAVRLWVAARLLPTLAAKVDSQNVSFATSTSRIGPQPSNIQRVMLAKQGVSPAVWGRCCPPRPSTCPLLGLAARRTGVLLPLQGAALVSAHHNVAC